MKKHIIYYEDSVKSVEWYYFRSFNRLIKYSDSYNGFKKAKTFNTTFNQYPSASDRFNSWIRFIYNCL